MNVLIRDELANLLRREVEDPELQGLISITAVETSPDLQSSKVYFSTLADEAQTLRVLRKLRKASGFFRRELAQRLNLRRTPELYFQLDPSIARGARVMQLLAEIEHEERSRPS